MKINLQKSAQQNLLDLINASNTNSVLASTNVTLGAVADYSNAGDTRRNTQVVVTALQDKGYAGSATIRYRRPTLAQVSKYAGATVTIAPSDTATQALAKVVAALGLLATEVVGPASFTMPANENDPQDFAINAIDGSYLYLKGELKVKVIVPDTDVALDSALTTKDLDGFDDN